MKAPMHQFRIYDTNLKKFIYAGEEDSRNIVISLSGRAFRTTGYKGEELIVQLSTGLQSGCGRTIYEGDVVEYSGQRFLVFWHDAYADFELADRSELPDNFDRPDLFWKSALNMKIVGFEV